MIGNYFRKWAVITQEEKQDARSNKQPCTYTGLHGR